MASGHSALDFHTVNMDKERTYPVGGNYRRREMDIENISFEDFHNPWSFYHLLNQDDTFVNDWMMRNGLLPRTLPCSRQCKLGEDLYGNEIMSECSGTMKASQRAGKASGATLRCDKNRKHEKTIRTNSFFEGSKLTIQDIMVFLKCYLDRNSLYLCSRSAGVSYKSTGVDWASFIRELFKEHYQRSIRHKQMKGIVEIDASLFGKRMKYHKGDPRKGLRIWVFEMVERATNSLIIYPVSDRRQETLLPLIQRHVQPGSTIYSDGWSAYCSLNDLGYTHFTVLHKYAFKKQYKNLATGEVTTVHTNAIEGAWKHAKDHFRKLVGTKASQWEGHLAEVMWRSQVSGSIYESFFTLLKSVYTLDEPARYFYTTPLFDSWSGIEDVHGFEDLMVEPALSDAHSTDPESDDLSMHTHSTRVSGATASVTHSEVITISTDEDVPTLKADTVALLSELFSGSSISGDDTMVQAKGTGQSSELQQCIPLPSVSGTKPKAQNTTREEKKKCSTKQKTWP